MLTLLRGGCWMICGNHASNVILVGGCLTGLLTSMTIRLRMPRCSVGYDGGARPVLNKAMGSLSCNGIQELPKQTLERLMPSFKVNG